MIVCPICRTRHPHGTAICQVCGHDLAALHLVVCPICGALNAAESEHCRRCATSLRDADLPTQAPPEAAATGHAAPVQGKPLPEPVATQPNQTAATPAPDASAPEAQARKSVAAAPRLLPSRALLPGQDPVVPLDPLAGLTAPLGLARAMAQPHRAALLPPEEPSDAERYDAALLGQIAAEPSHLHALSLAEGAHRLHQEPHAKLHPAWRAAIYLLLFAAALLPFLLPGLGNAWVQPRAAVIALANVVETLPESARVLLVWDYDASYGGEIDPLARALVNHLSTRQAQVEIIAMTPTSLGQAQRVIKAELGEQADGFSLLGYIPSGEAGWRLLADGVVADTPSVLTGAGATSLTTPLSGYGLVVLLADSATSVRGWAEQVGVYTAVSPFVVVTARSEPTLLPYVQSGQLRAVLGAAWAAPEYEIASRARPVAVARASGFVGLAAVILIVAIAAMLKGSGKGTRGGTR